MNPATQERYSLYIAPPRNYDAAKRYPLLLVLDGDDDFPLAATFADIVRAECELSAPPIVVGIGDGIGIDRPGNRRGRDYTPTASSVSWARGDGGADAFIRFVTQSVIPLIDKSFATSGGRTLFGYSYGGLLAAHAMLTTPTLASTWLLGSPSLYYDSNTVIRHVASGAKPMGRDTTRVFLSAGSTESWAIAGNADFSTALRSHSKSAFELYSTEIPGVGHSAGKPEALLRGMMWAYCSGAKRTALAPTAP